MKPLSLILLLILFTVDMAYAANAISQSPPVEKLYVGFGGLVDLPSQNLNNYSLGGGGELITGYCFNDYVYFQFRTDAFYFYSTGNASIFDLRPTLELKLAMDLKDFFQPYAFFGPGLDIQYNTINNITTSSANPALVGGLGVQFDLGDQIDIFVEGKYNLVFRNATLYETGGLLQDVPAEAGMTFGL